MPLLKATHAVDSWAKPQMPNCQSQLNDSQPVKAHGLEFSESPVIINLDVFVQRLKPYLRRKVLTYRRPPKRRPILCLYCIFGQHESCECEACTCAGEFRHVEERNRRHSKDAGGSV